MCDGIVWSRVHAGREMKDAGKYIDTYENITVTYLTHPECPLPPEKVKAVVDTIKKRLTKDIVKNLFVFRFQNVLDNLKRIKIYRQMPL